jgi:MSHA pilin protein MshC
MFRKIQTDFMAATFKLLRLILAVTIWLCHGLAAVVSGMTKIAETDSHVMLNSESVMPNLFRHLFRAGLFQHLVWFFSAFRRRGFNKPSNPRPLEPLNPSGFTLIEVIAVMIIVGILAATVLSRMDFGATSSRASVDGAANMIASDIRYAQEFAMANRVSKEIRFTLSSSSYSFFPSSSFDPSGQLQGATIGTTITFTFNSLGEPTLNGGGFVTVSGGGVSRTITVAQYTGKVSIS